MTTDTKLNQLIINKLTQEQYDEAKAAGTLSDTEFYITDSDDEALTNNNNISNCITEIPQDIKLELNNGTLTLKAGSKVYVPNGFEADGTTPKFDVKIIESDIIVESLYTDGPMFIYYVDNTVVPVPSSWSISGTSNTIIDGYSCWYDTTNNIIKIIAGDEVGSSGMSLPLAIANGSSNGDWTSIDQVFNGFGYMGSTVFALPGVKGLIPNGRNTDGSLKNIEFTTRNVLIYTVQNFTSNMYVLLNSTGISARDTSFIEYKEKENLVYNTSQSWIEYASICCNLYRINGKITSFTPKTVFHALDYNDAVKYSDRETIVGWGIPDYNSGITLTFNKVISHAGESKTMAKSGLFCFEFLANNVISTLYFYVNNHFVGKIGNSQTSVAFWDEINFPVTKGDVVKVTAEIDGGFTAAAVESYLFPYKGSMYE